MIKESIQTIKTGLMAISLFALVACSSTSDTEEEDAMGGEGSSSSGSSNNGSASGATMEFLGVVGGAIYK